MRRITLCLLVCLLLTGCTVGIVEREKSIPAASITPTPPARLTNTPRPTPTPGAKPTTTPVPPTHSPPPTVTPTPIPPTTQSPVASTISFEVTPTELDPGDTVTLTWEASGDRATICPITARFELFTSDDCQQVPLSGMMTFTIPSEATVLCFPISFLLHIETDNASAPEIQKASVWFKCHTSWFFSDEPQGCPEEPIRSYAAAQYFERGKMIWVEQLGRYIILEETLLYEGEIRRKVHYVYDPLEITCDTSTEISPPEGFYAPKSGFGLVWRGDVSNSPGYRESLGWALAPEFGYEAIYQCTHGYVTGGRLWQTCYLRGPDAEVIAFHPLGGWYPWSE